MKYIKSKIIALPSEIAKENGLSFNGGRFNTYLSSEAHYFNIGGEFDWQPYDLYFLTNEQIQEGDYVIDDTGLFGPVENNDVLINPKKIIATTDETLVITKKSKYTQFETNVEETKIQPLPKPTNEFIKKQSEMNGINEVLIKTTKLNTIKVSSDNTITIKPLINQK